MSTSICRSFGTICSGVNVFFGMSRFLLVRMGLDRGLARV